MTSIARQFGTMLRANADLLPRFVLTSIGRSALTMAGIFLIREFLSGVLGNAGGPAARIAAEWGSATALWVVAGLLLVTNVAASLLKYDNIVVEERIVRRVELWLMERLVRHLLSLSVAFLERQDRGDVLQAMRKDVENVRGVLIAWLGVFVEGIQAVGLFVTALWLSAWTLGVTLILLAGSFPIYVVARRTRSRSLRARNASFLLYDTVLELLQGIRVIRVFRGENEEAESAIAKARLYFDELVGIARVQSLAEMFLDSFAGFSLVFVVVVGGFQVLGGHLGWPELLAFLMAVAAVQKPLNQIGRAAMFLQRHTASVERIDEILAERPAVRDRPDGLPFPARPARLAFEGVGLLRDEEPVLDDVSFSVDAGETLGIVGPSGAGKTTLLGLAARFYEPSEGAIRIDGVELSAYRLGTFYDRLAIVTQEPFLFAATVRDNIRCGRADASDAEIVEAARSAGIHDEILALPEGYETVVGNGGRGLSLGQAQRINIARAMVKNAAVLLLDEATSNLDAIAESVVQQALDRLVAGRTTLIVAHRLSTLRHASRILVLDEGRCLALGTHEQLLRTCALYRGMWEQQRLADPAGEPGTAWRESEALT